MLIYDYLLVTASASGQNLRLIVGLSAEEAQLGTPAQRAAAVAGKVRLLFPEARIISTEPIPSLSPAVLSLNNLHLTTT